MIAWMVATALAVAGEPTAEAIEGAWRLVSSRSGAQAMESPGWEGQMVVEDGHFARTYLRRLAPATPGAPEFQCNAGVFTVSGDRIAMVVKFADWPPLRGITFDNALSLSADDRRLELRGPDFEEVWERLAP